MQTVDDIISQIARAIEQSGAKKGDIAEKAGMSQSELCKIANGVTKSPGIRKLLQITNALNIEICLRTIRERNWPK